MVEPRVIEAAASSSRALAFLIDSVGQTGFAGLVLDGFDVASATEAEIDPDLLSQAVEIALEGNEPGWAEHFALRLCQLDDRPPQRLRLASLLAAAGRWEEAGDLLTVPSAGDEDLRAQLQGVMLAKQGRTTEAMAVFDALPGAAQGYHPAPAMLPLAGRMMEQCDIAHSAPIMIALAERYPGHLLVRGLHLRARLYMGDLKTARALMNFDTADVARASTLERRTFVEASADLLELRGWTGELFEFTRESIERDPTHWSLYARASIAARSLARDDQYAKLVSVLSGAGKNAAQEMAVLCRWHIDSNRIAEAANLLDQLRPLSAPLYLNAGLYISMIEGDRQRFEAAFEACRSCRIPLMGPAVAYGFHIYYYDCSPEGLEKSLAKLEPFAGFAQTSASFWQIYLRCLIGLGKEQRAAQRYASLPKGLAEGAILKPFDLFFNASRGQHARARSGWTRYIRDTRHASVNARSSYPATLALKYGERPGAVLLFTTVHNGIDYIDWFLAHYRKLGVDHFFFVDNGSNDGGLEHLMSQADVSVFSNSGSFAQSAFGVLWMNHLMQRFGVGHWCFQVDIDEAFVFPDGGGSRSLRELLEYCDTNGHGCVSAIELDMYPERLSGDGGSDPFAASCYFDIDYSAIRAELPPYVMIQGGIRQRLTRLALSMQKTPLVRIEPDVRFIECNHSTTHVPVSDVTAALLHYKFAGDIKARFEHAISRGEHFAEAISYRRLNKAIEFVGPNDSLLSEYSRRYQGPHDLVRHGLLRSGPSWNVPKT